MVLLKDMDIIDGQTRAIDSFKIRAQNSLKNNFNQKKIDRHLEYIDKKIAEFEKELEGNIDETEQTKIIEKKATQEQGRKEYKAIEKELKEKIEGLRAKEVFVLFNNVFMLKNALEFKKLI